MKKKLTIYFLLSAFICFRTSAQEIKYSKSADQSNDIVLGITGGITSPFGNFTKTGFSDPKAGFAGPGFNLGITATWMLNKNVGITALISYHSYSFRGIQVLADSFKEAFAIDSATVTSKGNNYSVNFLVGPYYSFPLSDRFSLNARLLLGLTIAHLAGYEMDFEDNAASTFTQKESSTLSVALQAGVGGKYMFSEHLGVSLSIDYFYSKPDFSITYDNRNNNAGRWIKNYNEPINGINANLGLVYTIRR